MNTYQLGYNQAIDDIKVLFDKKLSFEIEFDLFGFSKQLDSLKKVIRENNEYNEERYCEYCDKETLHYCRDNNHERDSSSDYQECLECKNSK